MTTRLLILIAAAAATGLSQPTPGYRAILDQYCVTCHNEKTKAAGLMLDKIDLNHIPADAEIWEKVIRKVRVGMMPPQGLPRPDETTRNAFVSSLQTTLDRAAATNPNPGRPLVHRLNRAEYANAIRDLLALEVDPAALLPPDDSGYGFDNIADALGVSPVLLERYLNAAGKISALAVGDPGAGPAGETFRVSQEASQDVHIEGLPIGTVGGLLAKTTLPLDGEYVLQTNCSAPTSEPCVAWSIQTNSKSPWMASAFISLHSVATPISKPPSKTSPPRPMQSKRASPPACI
jgi:hypothetical protein